MTQILNISHLGAVLLPCVLALAPTFAIAQAQPTPPPASAPPADSMMGHHPMMMMDSDKMKSGMGMMDCSGKPCGPPAGAPGQMGGMPQSQGMAAPAAPMVDPAAPAAPAPMKEHM